MDLRITDFGIYRSPGTNPSRLLNTEGGRISQTYGLLVLCKVLELHTFILSAIPMPRSGNIFIQQIFNEYLLCVLALW